MLFGNAKLCGSDNLRLLLQLDLHPWVLECLLTAGSVLIQQRKTFPRGQAIALFVRKRDPLCVSYWNSVKKCLTHL